MAARRRRAEPASGTNDGGRLLVLLAEYERMSEAWRRQLQATLEGFDELETERRKILEAAVRAAAIVASLGSAPDGRLLPALPVLIADYERNVIQWALANTKGNQKGAAALLGVRHTTLHEKMKRLGLIRSRSGAPEEGRTMDNGAGALVAPHHLR